MTHITGEHAMSEMIERVARAIGLRRMFEGPMGQFIGSYESEQVIESFDRLWNEGQSEHDHEQRAAYRADARAAIEAMREPTWAMEIAGHEADYLRDVWYAMIDAALTTNPTAPESKD